MIPGVNLLSLTIRYGGAGPVQIPARPGPIPGGVWIPVGNGTVLEMIKQDKFCSCMGRVRGRNDPLRSLPREGRDYLERLGGLHTYHSRHMIVLICTGLHDSYACIAVCSHVHAGCLYDIHLMLCLLLQICGTSCVPASPDAG